MDESLSKVRAFETKNGLLDCTIYESKIGFLLIDIMADRRGQKETCPLQKWVKLGIS